MTDPREPEFYDDPGPVARPYAVVRGQLGDLRHDLDLITLVVAVRSDGCLPRMEPESADIVRLCARPLSVAEIAAHVRLPLLVTKTVVSDLITKGYLAFRTPTETRQRDSNDVDLLQAVLNGIRKL